MPLSNLYEASVCRPWRRDVLRTDTGLKVALSRNTEVVSADTPDLSPPKTPAMHMPSEALQIIRSEAASSRSTPSRVTNFDPAGSVLTTTLSPVTAAASKACRGCPVSWRTKLVMSTTLLIGLRPIDLRRCWSHSGDGFTVMPRIVSPEYLMHCDVASTLTVIAPSDLSFRNDSTEGSFALTGFLRLKYAARSRATP